MLSASLVTSSLSVASSASCAVMLIWHMPLSYGFFTPTRTDPSSLNCRGFPSLRPVLSQAQIGINSSRNCIFYVPDLASGKVYSDVFVHVMAQIPNAMIPITTPVIILFIKLLYWGVYVYMVMITLGFLPPGEIEPHILVVYCLAFPLQTFSLLASRNPFRSDQD